MFGNKKSLVITKTLSLAEAQRGEKKLGIRVQEVGFRRQGGQYFWEQESEKRRK
jgi:hypothetical protein